MDPMDAPFKWRHYAGEIILLCVRWYLRYTLSYRDVAEMMEERGLTIDHTTIWRWVHAYAPEVHRRVKPHLKATNDSWRVDETYIQIKTQWHYLYRAIDSTGQTLDFMLSPSRNTQAAYDFFFQTLQAEHVRVPRVINVDKADAFPPAFDALIAEGHLPVTTQLRQCKYLNNIIEQDHRFIKRRVRPMLGFKRFKSADCTLQGIETMHMLRKNQIQRLEKANIKMQVHFIEELFGIAA